MKKKWLLFLIGLAGLLIFSITVTWFDFSKLERFLSNDELIHEINSSVPNVTVRAIQDVVQLDERHIYVPYISQEGHYNDSYWIWKRGRWQVNMLNSPSKPQIWKIKKEDPSSYYFVWNFPRDDEWSELKLYYIRNRSYSISEDMGSYYPRVQLEEKVSLVEKSYGALQLPKEWVSTIKPFIEVEKAKQPNFFHEQSIYFGWMSYDQFGREKIPESRSGVGHYYGHADIDHLMFISEEQLELPSEKNR